MTICSLRRYKEVQTKGGLSVLSSLGEGNGVSHGGKQELVLVEMQLQIEIIQSYDMNELHE
jgi:hypothetical protein